MIQHNHVIGHSHRRSLSSLPFETIQAYDTNFFPDAGIKKAVLENEQVQKKVFLPFTNERDQLGRLNLNARQAVEVVQAQDSAENSPQQLTNGFNQKNTLRKQKPTGEKLILHPRNKNSLNLLFKPSLNTSHSVIPGAEFFSLTHSQVASPVQSVCNEVPAINNIQQSMFELTQSKDFPVYYEVNKRAHQTDSFIQKSASKARSAITSPSSTMRSPFMPSRPESKYSVPLTPIEYPRKSRASFLTKNVDEIYSEKRGWKKEDILQKSTEQTQQKQYERMLYPNGVKKRSPLKLKNPLRETKGTSTFGIYSIEGERKLHLRSPSCIILPERKSIQCADVDDVPKLEFKNILSSRGSRDTDLKKESTTNRKMNEEYKWIMSAVNKKQQIEPVNHWKLSLKLLNNFDNFPNEWMDEMKNLKIRVSQLRMDLHSAFKTNY